MKIELELFAYKAYYIAVKIVKNRPLNVKHVQYKKNHYKLRITTGILVEKKSTKLYLVYMFK